MRFEDWLIREGYHFTKYLGHRWGWVRNNRLAATSVLDALRQEFIKEITEKGLKEI